MYIRDFARVLQCSSYCYTGAMQKNQTEEVPLRKFKRERCCVHTSLFITIVILLFIVIVIECALNLMSMRTMQEPID